MLTIAVIAVLKVDSDPKPIDYVVPRLKGDPATRLEDSTNEEELEPVLESGEGEQDGGKSRDGGFFGEGVCDARKVCLEVAKVHCVFVSERGWI